MNVIRNQTGWIEVICGSMFSGKTEELIRRLRRAEIARQKVQIFKPVIDSRYSVDHITSHDQSKLVANTVRKAVDILELLTNDTEVVGIDEAQFFNLDLVEVCQTLADRGLRVIVAGLDQDYKGVPFEPIGIPKRFERFSTSKEIRLTLLKEEKMYEARHSHGSCRISRSPFNF